MCQVLGVSRSGDDDWKNRKPSARTVKREGLKKLGIRSITKRNTRQRPIKSISFLYPPIY
uniref:hypothetical protein n=1 Tax=Staphylococcus pseudintermedius TaxID=283734 RepID=UPI00288A8ED2|nr:hypothetical protein [Staphylococcus pseudintermedius]